MKPMRSPSPTANWPLLFSEETADLVIDAEIKQSNNNNITKDDLSIIRKLIDSGVDINLQGKGGITALIAASKAGKLDVVKFLVAAGANVNLQTESGFTALMVAAGDGNLEIVKVLVHAGADSSLKNKQGLTALMLASKKNYTEIITFLQGAEVKLS